MLHIESMVWCASYFEYRYSSHLSHSSAAVLASTEVEKKWKHCAFSSDCHATFTLLLCFAVDGLAGDEANGFLRHLTCSLSIKWGCNFSEVLGWLHARLAFALVQATNVCIQGSRIQWQSLGMEDGAVIPFD